MPWLKNRGEDQVLILATGLIMASTKYRGRHIVTVDET